MTSVGSILAALVVVAALMVFLGSSPAPSHSDRVAAAIAGETKSGTLALDLAEAQIVVVSGPELATVPQKETPACKPYDGTWKAQTSGLTLNMKNCVGTLKWIGTNYQATLKFTTRGHTASLLRGTVSVGNKLLKKGTPVQLRRKPTSKTLLFVPNGLQPARFCRPSVVKSNSWCTGDAPPA